MQSYLTYLEAREKPVQDHLRNALKDLELAQSLRKSDSDIQSAIIALRVIISQYDKVESDTKQILGC